MTHLSAACCSAQHWDFFFDEVNTRNGGNRYATVLMYLEAADDGGETVRRLGACQERRCWLGKVSARNDDFKGNVPITKSVC